VHGGRFARGSRQGEEKTKKRQRSATSIEERARADMRARWHGRKTRGKDGGLVDRVKGRKDSRAPHKERQDNLGEGRGGAGGNVPATGKYLEAG